jgi:hypothetical protein
MNSKTLHNTLKQTKTVDRTNINNILTTINYNINDCEAINNDSTSSPSIDFVKKEVVKNDNTAVLPINWQFVKCELFDNGTPLKSKHKVAVTICRNGRLERFKALCNSPFRHLKRGLDSDTWSHSTHFENIRKIYGDLREQRVYPTLSINASKCYMHGIKNGKGKHMVGLSVILAQDIDIGNYKLFLFYDKEIFAIQMCGNGTKKLSRPQRSKNIVATGIIRQKKLTQKQGIDATEILG